MSPLMKGPTRVSRIFFPYGLMGGLAVGAALLA